MPYSITNPAVASKHAALAAAAAQENDDKDDDFHSAAMEVDSEQNDHDAEEVVEAAVVHAHDEADAAHSNDDDDDDDDDDEGGDDDDDEEVLAAVVVEDHGDTNGKKNGNHHRAAHGHDNVDVEDEDGTTPEVVEAAVVVEATPTAATKQSPKRKTHPKKKATSKKTASGSTSPAKKKKKKKKRVSAASHVVLEGTVSPQRLEAATDARLMLKETVPTLPIPVGETVVRCFGRLLVEPENIKVSKFATPNALYPVGFSCDRYEFSPVHGRVLKMRCSILDGRKIKQKLKAAGHQDKLVNHGFVIPDGPVFRVMWGRGVDEDTTVVDYPFDPMQDATPMTASSSNSSIIPSSSSTHSFSPAVGMRVRVRFSKDRSFDGTITMVQESTSKKKRKPVFKISINYDDGSKETLLYPDPDVSLLMPGKLFVYPGECIDFYEIAVE